MHKTWLLLLASALSLSPARLGAVEPADSSVPAPGNAAAFQLSLSKTTGSIRIDGRLDDAGWQDATHIDQFTEFLPTEGADPQVRTEVLLTYDESHLYVAFRAYDDPARIRASLQERDRPIEDDWVLVQIDTYGEANWAYGLGATPLGIQLDFRSEGLNWRPSLDVLYRSAGQITAEGYEVEMAIPFSSLRFPQSEVQSWRINFIRNHPREDRHLYTWVPVTLDDPCTLCQSGTIGGMRGIERGGRLRLLPSLVASQSGSLAEPGNLASPFENGNPGAALSLGMEYDLGGGWTAEATYNPDFSQVEADANQIDINSALAIRYPEKRPFFLSGADLFQTPLPVTYSRSINDPLWAGKLTGRVGSTDVVFLAASDEHTPLVLPFDGRSLIREAGASTTSLLRAKHNLSSGTYVGALFTDRRFEGGGSGTNLGIDGSLRLHKHYEVGFQLVGSHTAELEAPTLDLPAGLRFGKNDRYSAAMDGEVYSGLAGHLALSRRDKRSVLEATYSTANPTYRADNGFQRQNDFHEVEAYTAAILRPEDSWASWIQPGVRVTRGWTFAGESRLSKVSPSVAVELPRQTMVQLGAEVRDETFAQIDFSGLRKGSLFIRSSFSEPLSLGAYASYGDEIVRFLATPERGRETSLSAWATVKPLPRVVIEPRLMYQRMTSPSSDETLYSTYIARTKLNYQFTRELFVRLTAQYNDQTGRLELDPLLTYKLNPYSMFYIGSTHDVNWAEGTNGPVQTERQIFMKVQYLFRP